MGANYEGQKKAIEELSNLSKEAKSFLCHHISNALNVVIGGITSGELDIAEEAAWHILEDLRLAGIASDRKHIEKLQQEVRP